jgi:hypothetical protein
LDQISPPTHPFPGSVGSDLSSFWGQFLPARGRIIVHFNFLQ